jgi:hypothetical protein
VTLSERLRTLYGPLLILPAVWEEKKVIDEPVQLSIRLELPRGSAAVDPSKVAITFGGRTLYPTSVWNPWTLEKFQGPVQLTGQSRAHTFELRYEVRTTELEPFTLHLPEFQVNGRVFKPDPIAFRRAMREAAR